MERSVDGICRIIKREKWPPPPFSYSTDYPHNEHRMLLRHWTHGQ